MHVEPTVPLRAIWRLAASNVINIIPFALLMPVLAIELARQGVSATAVGIFGLAPFLAILVLAPHTAHLRARIGATLAHQLGLVLTVAGALLTTAGEDFWLWSAAMLLMGVAGAVLWGITEGLLAECAPEARLGHHTGIFQTLVGAAFTIGPFVPILARTSLEGSRWVACAISLLAWVPILGLPRMVGSVHATPRLREQAGGILRSTPDLLIVAMLGGVFENGVNALGPVHGLHLGLGERTALLITGIIAAGSLATQYPIGRMADRVRSHRLQTIAMVALLTTCLVLPLAGVWPALIWPLALVWGAVGGALYTLVMIEIGQVYRGSGRVAVATGLVISSYTLGALVGPALAGPAMDLWPDHGLALALGAATLLGLFARAFSRRADTQPPS